MEQECTGNVLRVIIINRDRFKEDLVSPLYVTVRKDIANFIAEQVSLLSLIATNWCGNPIVSHSLTLGRVPSVCNGFLRAGGSGGRKAVVDGEKEPPPWYHVSNIICVDK